MRVLYGVKKDVLLPPQKNQKIVKNNVCNSRNSRATIQD